MDNEDIQIGQVFTRRKVIQLFGAGFFVGTEHPPSSELSHAKSLPVCMMRPQQTEGPFFEDVKLERSDIRVDSDTKSVSSGLPIEIKIQAMQVDKNQCVPLTGARVDLWHCDLDGRYSGFRNQGEDLRNENFLRGYQLTNDTGLVKFMTVYPGWYPGRTVHVHLKISTINKDDRIFEFTTQLYFDDNITDQVYSTNAYRHLKSRRIRNLNDWIFRRYGGKQLMLDLSPSDSGYLATFPIGLQLPDAN